MKKPWKSLISNWKLLPRLFNAQGNACMNIVNIQLKHNFLYIVARRWDCQPKSQFQNGIQERWIRLQQKWEEFFLLVSNSCGPIAILKMFNCSHAQPDSNSVSFEITWKVVFTSASIYRNADNDLFCFQIIASDVSTTCLESSNRRTHEVFKKSVPYFKA